MSRKRGRNRLPRRDVSPKVAAVIGELDPALCKRVASFVDHERRSYRVDVALIEIGSREGFGLTKGFEILSAGRYLWTTKENEKHGRQEHSAPRSRR